MEKYYHVHILGAGIAGLSVGYFAKKNGFPITIYEASDQIGGNSTTIKYGEYLFDSGAHRFHDKDTQMTTEIRTLLGEELMRIDVPSQIYSRNRFMDFPISPLNLLRNIGIFLFARASFEILDARIRKGNTHETFKSYALNTYGKTIANRFLLNYSEKLWGKESSQLSPSVAGNRLKGLDIRTFILEALSGTKSKTEHLDGAFLYPQKGIGMIADKLAEMCGEKNIITNAAIKKILHTNDHIYAIEVNAKDIIAVDQVVSTIPLSLFIKMMEPKPPDSIISVAESLNYRNVLLVALVIGKKSVMNFASLYFPEDDFPFTRIYEPKNRSNHMAPRGTTLLVAEIPCQKEEPIWNYSNRELIDLVQSKLCRIGIINQDDIIDATVYRLVNAYPILEVGVEKKLRIINSYLNTFKKLRRAGFNGRFKYTHIHEIMRSGKITVENYVKDLDDFDVEKKR